MQTTSKGAKSKDHVPFNRKKGKRIPSGVLEGMNRTARSSKSEFLQSNDRGAIHQGSTVE